MKEKVLFIAIFCSCFIPTMAQQNDVRSILNKESQKYWNNAMIYKEEAKNFSETELVINELEKLISIQEYPDAYLELGKLYGKGYVSSWISRSEECFEKYIELCPDKKGVADEEKNKCEIFRNIRKKRFEKKLVGKWSTFPNFGDSYFCFEVNSNGSVTVPYKYFNGRVVDWQTINFGYWPDYGKFTLSTNSSSHAESFKVICVDSEDVSYAYVHICFFYQENEESLIDNKLICYVNQAIGNSSWVWNENHKIIFNKIQ